MGKFLDKFKDKANSTNEKLAGYIENKNDSSGYNSNKIVPQNQGMGDIVGTDDDYDDYHEEDNYNDGYDDVGILKAQKPESFHHFLLENQYKDLEKSIRGYKDVFDKKTNTWIVKRKEVHCFTDEEAEMIVRAAQSHLSTDIKLSRIRIDTFGDYMDALYKQLEYLFERISEYQYGRYDGYKLQGDMKTQNIKIFLELWTRIQSNYSRAIDASENKMTHSSVRGQESLQSGDRDYTGQNKVYN